MATGEMGNFVGILETIERRCRTCLEICTEFNELSKHVKIGDSCLTLTDLILCCASIQISNEDGFPQQICDSCKDAAIKSHMFRIQCEISDKYFQSFNERINNSIKFETTVNPQTVQNNSFVDSVSKNEVISNVDNSPPKPENFSTDEEEETTKTATESQNPQNSNHLKRQTDPKACENVKKRTCPFCEKIFQYRTSMLKHLKNHTAPPKTCTYCTFHPSTPSALSKHMEQTHAHLKTFTCSLCNKAFFKKANLRLHVQVHSGVKKHTCETCGMSFVLRGNLSVHRRLHTGERPYTCSACGRGFTQQSALRSHEAGHSDRRDHVCPECGAAFSRAGALRNHTKRHSTARPYECSVCAKRFTFSSERKRHMLVHTGDKNHECEVCGRRFTRSTNLRVHKRIHTGETPHVCAVCGKGFIQAHCLRTHMNTHRKNSGSGGK